MSNTHFCGIKGARVNMGVPYKRLKAGRRAASDRAAYKRAMRVVAAKAKAATSTGEVPCPERGCTGVAPVPRHLERGGLVRCLTCGCRFNPGDPSAEELAAAAAATFAANVAAKVAEGGGHGAGPTRHDGVARHVHRMDRQRRGSDMLEM